MLIVGMKVRLTNPRATPRYTVLALSRSFVTIWHPNGYKWKVPRGRVARVNGFDGVPAGSLRGLWSATR